MVSGDTILILFFPSGITCTQEAYLELWVIQRLASSISLSWFSQSRDWVPPTCPDNEGGRLLNYESHDLETTIYFHWNIFSLVPPW